MEIPEIEYRPEAPSVKFAPVQQVDVTAAMQDNHNRSIQDMNQRLQQMERNAAVKLKNAKDQAFPVEKLAQFSKTIQSFMQDRIDKNKKDAENEASWLAFTEGVPSDPVFDENEKQINKIGFDINMRADVYERQTGDIETAERVRNLSGKRNYTFLAKKTLETGKVFGSFMDANKYNEEFAVNGYTLASAPDQPTRQAVAAKMVAAYIRPFSGMNKSFLGKYLFPGMQSGMSAAIASAAEANAKLLRENRRDAALTAFRNSPSPEGMMELDRLLRNDRYDNKTIRTYIIDEMTQVDSDAVFERLMNTPYGPNGMAFQLQYKKEAAELRVNREAYQQRVVQAAEMDLDTRDREELLKVQELVASDFAKDGELNANPERLEEMRDGAIALNYSKTAAYLNSMIAETAYMKNSTTVREQYEAQMQAGIMPSNKEILENPALSKQDKQALLGKAGSSGGQEPVSDLAKGHKQEIDAAIKQRGGYTQAGSRDPSIPGMKNRAWREYKQVYARELAANGGDTEAAAEAAMKDFYAKFGDDKYKGLYALNSGEVGPGKAFKYKNYDTTGELSTAIDPMSQIREKTQGSTAFMTIGEALNEPDLYGGEDVQLQNLQKTFTTTGRIGVIPPVYYQLQQQLGGKVSIMDLVNRRLEANGLPTLPKELNDTVKSIENVFDDETYKDVCYKPNSTKTDRCLINMGEEPIYSTTLPTNVASDIEFLQEVSAMAGRIGISEADLMAVMAFETRNTFSPSIPNAKKSGAIGLIQFMPGTAIELGTTTEALAQMSRVEQLKYVEKYLVNKGIKPGAKLDDLYMTVLFPAAVGQPDNFVLFGNGALDGYGLDSVSWEKNKGLDSNGDDSVTKAEAAAKVMQYRNPNPWRRPNNMRPELQ